MKPAHPKPAAAEDAFRETIVHELSQPVTALQGSLEVALRGRQTRPELKQAIEIALEQARRIAALLSDLKDRHPRPSRRTVPPAKSRTSQSRL